jgi:hypothetical protein
MPITFKVERDKRAVLTTALGNVSVGEVLHHIRAKAEQQAADFNELFDARHVLLDLTSADLIAIAKAVRDTLRNENPGKSAVVTDDATIYTLAKTYVDLTGKEASDLHVFARIEDARAWLGLPDGS